MTLKAGDSLGRYRIVARLGSGGMATVYKAYLPSLDRTVALKVLRLGLADDDPLARERFEFEAKAVAKLRHPNIVTLFDFDDVDGQTFIVMEYLDGATLKTRLRDLTAAGQRMSISDVANVIGGVAAALTYAHVQGLVHRDVKPSNIMLPSDGRAVLTDFGIAKMLSAIQSPRTQTGVGVGTAAYMAPEQAEGGEITAAADTYALGVVAFEALTGRVPFTADAPLAVLLAHVKDPLLLPTALRAEIGHATEMALLRALAKRPDERYPSTSEFGNAFMQATEADALRTDPPSVTSLQATPSARLVCPTLIGRREELATLEGCLSDIAAGRGRMVLVSGEAGIGKTALLRMFSDRSRAEGARVFTGECTEVEARRPFSPFVDIVRSQPPQAGELLRLLPESAGPTESTDKNESGRYRMHDALVAFVAELATKTPVVLVIEDVQWADESTLELLPFLARRLRDRRVLLVASYRSDELHRRHPLRGVLAELARTRTVEEIRLKRLDIDEVGALLRATMRLDRDPTPAFCAAVDERCEGNPFFVEEVLKALDENGEIALQNGQWRRTKDVPDLTIPNSVRDAVLYRLRLLSDDARECLQVAAVIGQRFDFELLRRALARAEGTVLRDLRSAIEAQLVVELAGDGGPDRYAFRHALTRESVRSELLERERRGWHDVVGHAIETMANASQQFEELAYHFDEASDRERAFRYRDLAARQATRMLAFARATRHLERAIALAPADDAIIGELELRLATATLWLADLSHAIHAAEEAHKHFVAAGDVLRTGEALERVALIRWHLGENALARAAAAEAVRVLEPLGASAELASAYHEVARLTQLELDHAAVPAIAEKAIEMARETGALGVQADALQTLGTALDDMGRGEGIALMRESVAMSVRHGLWQQAERGYSNLWWTIRSRGDAAGARQVSDEMHDSSRLHGLRREQEISIDVVYALSEGDWDSVLRLAAEVPTESVRSADIQLVASLVRTAREGPAEGKGSAEQARRVLSKSSVMWRFGMSADLAQLSLLAGEPTETLTVTEGTGPLFERKFPIFPAVKAAQLLVCAISAAARLEEREAWNRWIERALRRVDSQDVSSAARAFALGERAAALRDRGQAIGHFEEAATGLRAALLPLAATLADMRLTELLMERGQTGDFARADEVLGVIFSYYRKAKATWYLTELQRWAAAHALRIPSEAPAMATRSIPAARPG